MGCTLSHAVSGVRVVDGNTDVACCACYPAVVTYPLLLASLLLLVCLLLLM